jgi:fused signal recognition particle receptor
MAELGKIKRVIEKVTPVNEVLLVVDATTGQNGLSQAKLFSEAVEVTGIVLTKLDGSARGGIALAIEHDLDLPIKWIGTGEAIGDLTPFDPEIYITGILDAE